MSNRGIRQFLLAALVLALAVSVPGPARAFDLGAPGRLVGKLLGREGGKTAEPATRPPAGSRPVSGRGLPSAATAAADTLSAEDVVDEVLLSPEPYYYQSMGRRDPFVSLVQDEAGDAEGVGLDQIFVRGILWGDNDRFALIETSDGTSSILREGDSFGRFEVRKIDPDGIVVYGSEFGVGRTSRLPLSEWKGSKNARGER